MLRGVGRSVEIGDLQGEIAVEAVAGFDVGVACRRDVPGVARACAALQAKHGRNDCCVIGKRCRGERQEHFVLLVAAIVAEAQAHVERWSLVTSTFTWRRAASRSTENSADRRNHWCVSCRRAISSRATS